MFKHLFFWIFIVSGSFYYIDSRPVSHGPGIVAPKTPLQQKTVTVKSFEKNDCKIVPKAKFHIEARVLSKEWYFWDKQSDISPYDLVLGWGPMSDERNLTFMYIEQSDRYYSWKTTHPPLPRKKIISHSANMHMIPANDLIKDKLGKVRVGQVVRIDGYLANVDIDYSFTWETSLSRTDEGKGSSEIVWVKNFKVL